MAERTRTDWKGKYDAKSVECDTLQAKANEQQKELELVNGLLEAKDREIEDLKKAVQRARLEGAKATTESLLALS